ncbi:hypothetical protein Tco_1409799 [Tanacetum coccineum]
MTAKDSGGLGIASFFALNRALLCKWIWKFITQKNSLWARVISAIHGKEVKSGNITNHSSIWYSIVKEIENLKLHGIDVLSLIKPICGDGTCTSFWHDVWRGDVAFKNLAPRIFMLENLKDITVASKMSQVDMACSFRRKPRSGLESHQMDLLLGSLEGVILSLSQDRWKWDLDGSGVFSVSSLRRVIDDAFLPKGNMKTRWVSAIPNKVNILAGKSLTTTYPPDLICLEEVWMSAPYYVLYAIARPKHLRTQEQKAE